jgi:hypothetical protein
MQLCLLLEDKLLPVPETIKIIFDAGHLPVIMNDKQQSFYVGDHVILEGDKGEFIKWLKPFNGILVGFGPMPLQQFKMRHIA